MIKFNDVLEGASKVMNQDDLKDFTKYESLGKSGEQHSLVMQLGHIIEQEALSSIYSEECDMVIFSRYKHWVDFEKLYEKYIDYKYATGS